MSVFITHPSFSGAAWNALHPLAISRHAPLLALCRSLGWLKPDSLVECETASEAELAAFHDADYVAALRHACASGRVDAEARQTYNFGSFENPIFPGLFERASASVGGSIAAARLAMRGGAAFHPAGGTHHGKRNRADGFCYFNDPVFAIATLLDEGAASVAYVDLDAHHGDGVEQAFAERADVRLFSIHEAGRWPYPDAGERPSNAENFAVPRHLNDTELLFLTEHIARALDATRPDAIVIVAGADCLRGDPLSKMHVSNGALWHAVSRLCALAPARVVLGGGGYNPWTTVRGWAGLWATLSGQAIPDELNQEQQAILNQLSCDLIDEDEFDPSWRTRLADAPNPGPVRDDVRALAARAIEPAAPAA